MLPLRKTKGLCFRLLLLLFCLTVITTAVSNVWKYFHRTQHGRHVPMNLRTLIRDEVRPHSFNITFKLIKNEQNEDTIINNILEKVTGNNTSNDKRRCDKTVFIEKIATDNDRESEIRKKSADNVYRGANVQSVPGNGRSEKEPQDVLDKGGENSKYSEAIYKRDFETTGIRTRVSNRGHDEDNNTAVVVDKDWILALRAATTNMGILRKRNLHWTIEMAGNYSSKLFTPPPGEFPKQRLPQAIIFGVGHCGTRALIEFLKMHPYIVPSNTEIHFFDRDINFVQGYGWYRAQMPLSYSNQLTVEKTPSYIWCERALHEVYEMNKNMKLIVIMKDPVSRLVSMKLSSSVEMTRNSYNMQSVTNKRPITCPLYNTGPQHRPQLIKTMQMITVNGVQELNYFSQALIHGAYVTYLKPWLQKFPPSQIHIIEGSDFVKDPASEIAKIESFLGVPHFLEEKNFYFNKTKGFYCVRPLHIDRIVCLNDMKGRKHPKLDPEVKKTLYDYYKNFNEKLFKLLGKRFPWENE